MVYQIECAFPERGIRYAFPVIHPADPVDDLHVPGDIPVGMQQTIIRIIDMSRFGIYPVQLQDPDILSLVEIIKASRFDIESPVINPGNISGNP